MSKKNRKLGYILEGPGRPVLATQREKMGLVGVDVADEAVLFHDAIEKGSPHPRRQLLARNQLLEHVQKGDVVVACDAYCVGLSVKDVQWFLQELATRLVSLVVCGDITRIEPGDDPTSVLQAVRTSQSVTQVRAAERRRLAKEMRDDLKGQR